MADVVVAGLALAVPDCDELVLVVLLGLVEAVDDVVGAVELVTDSDCELDDELDADGEADGGGLPVDVVVAEDEADALDDEV